MQMRLAALSTGLREGGICILRQGADHRFGLAENVPQQWLRQDLVGLVESDALPAEIAADFVTAHNLTRSQNLRQNLSFGMGTGLRRREFAIVMLPDVDGITSVVTDVTEAVARDLAMTTLLREVSHRSKNLLAIVQSVAMQTAHHTRDVQEFLDRFRGRLHALSSTQDLVTESDWRGTYLQSLVMSQLSRVGPSALGHTRVTGENPLLGPNASLHIGLAIHELAANSILHGAMAEHTAGHVWIDAQLVGAPGLKADLVIEWQETGLDLEDSTREPRFGSLILERIVPLSVGGTASFRIDTTTVNYRLTVPADQFEA
ncbi:sensor histidine kinase [Devosia sp. 2618]|uniref:sensor histidine kinase n=1 Tax=Devosia sp. 2618 TaxID=3156454 RepID=UPI0033954039